MRGNLHVGVGFLSATSGAPAERRLRFGRAAGLAYMEAGEGDPVVMIHGLGGTKASFLPTVVGPRRGPAITRSRSTSPGFGDSEKPLFAPYDAPTWHARRCDVPRRARDRHGALHRQQPGRAGDARARAGAPRAHAQARAARLLARLEAAAGVGALPVAGAARARADPARPAADRRRDRARLDSERRGRLGRRRDRRVRALVLHAARPRRVLRSRPPHPARALGGVLGAARRHSTGRRCSCGAARTAIVPPSFARHVREALPSAKHAELDCGHVPQIERPGETEAVLKRFLAPEPAREQALDLARLVELHRPDQRRIGGKPDADRRPDRRPPGRRARARAASSRTSHIAQVDDRLEQRPRRACSRPRRAFRAPRLRPGRAAA